MPLSAPTPFGASILNPLIFYRAWPLILGRFCLHSPGVPTSGGSFLLSDHLSAAQPADVCWLRLRAGLQYLARMELYRHISRTHLPMEMYHDSNPEKSLGRWPMSRSKSFSTPTERRTSNQSTSATHVTALNVWTIRRVSGTILSQISPWISKRSSKAFKPTPGGMSRGKTTFRGSTGRMNPPSRQQRLPK